MSRWNDTITLLSYGEPWVDAEGGEHEGERMSREVFCNPGIIGTMAIAQLRSSEVRVNNGSGPDVGMRAAVMVYVRTIDYADEDQVIYHGKEMQVISATSEGENTKLLMRRRIGND